MIKHKRTQPIAVHMRDWYIVCYRINERPRKIQGFWRIDSEVVNFSRENNIEDIIYQNDINGSWGYKIPDKINYQLFMLAFGDLFNFVTHFKD